MESQRRVVVLDGSNIVSMIADEEGTDGRILLSAIEFYENLGYTVIPVMDGGTIGYMKKNNHPGAKTLGGMARNESIRTLSDGADEGIIQIALRRDGWIVTYDTFSHGKKDKDGNTIPPERERYPDWDWDDIDERTRGTEKISDGRVFSRRHWKVDDTDFHDPSMPKAPKELLSSEYTEFRRDLQLATRKIDRMLVFLDEADPAELTKVMTRKILKIRKEITEVKRMVPTTQLPEDTTIDKLLVAECKQLINLINDIDEEANLTLSGRKDELKARIKEYTAKARVHRAQLEAEENTRLKAIREEKEAAEEAGMTLSKYRKSQRMKKHLELQKERKEKRKERNKEKKKEKAEREGAREQSYRADWDIVLNIAEDEFVGIVIGAIEEAIGHKLEASAKVSLDNENRLVNFESPLDKEDREFLIKNHYAWRQRLSQELGLENSIRVIIL